jgi:hypothetical protein
LWERYVDRIPESDIRSYETLDARIGILVGKSVEVAITGKDLLESRHVEFASEVLGTRLYVERRVIASVSWRF